MIKNKILKKLEKKFGEKNIIIFDESKKHKLSNRESSHFKIIIVSDNFIDQNLIKRHKNIYSLLLNSIHRYNIHAISLHLYTKNEFINIKNDNIKSPNCIKNKE